MFINFTQRQFGLTDHRIPAQQKALDVSSHLDRLMRIIFILFLALCSLTTFGQKVEYRNDSLYINGLFINAQTKNSTLDSVLNAKGRNKTSRSSFKINPATDKKVIEATRFYYDLGLFFRTYDYDTTQLSIGIKLYRDTDKKEDKQSELTDTFKGQLYIADNYMNDKRSIEELEQLRNCRITISKASLGTYSTIIGGDIIYMENVIRLSFDKTTKELKAIYIHHNFKDR
jgi:hypothetical protein